MSLAEAIANATLGLIVSWLFTYLALPLFGYQPSALTAVSITACYFGLSLARGYLVRRVFVWVER